MNLTEYFISKKIDPDKFKIKEIDVWIKLEEEFKEMHPKSFTNQKLYLINSWRRRYPLQKEM